MEKRALRILMLKKRGSLSPKEVRELSRKICSKILKLPEIKASKSIGIYLSFRNEVAAEMLLARLSSMGKKVFAPVLSLNGELKFARLHRVKETRPGRGGTREPINREFARSGKIETFIIPGLAFDHKGFRIGLGKGHYDRYLSRNKKPVKIGAAYDFQVVQKFNPEPHDVRMDLVVTEKRVLRFKRS